MDFLCVFRPSTRMRIAPLTSPSPATARPRHRRRALAVAALGLVVATVAACSSGGENTGLAAALTAGSLPAGDSLIANAAPTTVYAVIAQKALACWMGPKGPLKGTHIFHADAASPTTGGRAEIALHERDTSQPHPWGGRVFRIELTPEGGGTDTRITMVNIKLSHDLADALRTDVATWANGSDGCQAQVVRPPPPEPVAPAAAAKGKAKGAKATAKAG